MGQWGRSWWFLLVTFVDWEGHAMSANATCWRIVAVGSAAGPVRVDNTVGEPDASLTYSSQPPLV